MNRRQQKIINQMIVTIVGAIFYLLVVIPWFTGRMKEVAERPKIRMQQKIAAQQAEVERRARVERETMSNVHRLVREAKEEEKAKRVVATYSPELVHETDRPLFDKEAAWKRWYRKSAECAGGNSIECGNYYIRKRREFEALVLAGKIR